MSDAPDSTPRTVSAQDRALQDEITAWERSLEAARDDAEVQAILAPVGFGPKELNDLLVLVAAAQTGYDRRAAAMGRQTEARDAKDDLEASTRKEYGVFRDLARARLKGNEAAYDALSLRGDIPGALNEFVTHARGAYANAGVAPYASDLAKRGYTADRLDKLTLELDGLVEAAKTATETRAGAKASTGARDEAAGVARKGFAEYRDTARPLLGPQAGRVNL